MKHIKVLDISPKQKSRVEPASVKIEKKEDIEEIKKEPIIKTLQAEKEIITEKLQSVQEVKEHGQGQLQAEQLETDQEQAGKEFLSKWFYKKKKADIEDEISIEEEEEKEEIKKESEKSAKKEIIKEVKEVEKKIKIEEEEENEDFLKDEIESQKAFNSKIVKYVAVVLVLLVFGGGVYAAMEILPKAEIKITMKKIMWNFNNSVSASKNIGEINVENKQIPANFFSEKKNVTLSYPATGKKSGEQKSEGEIIIYNAYSSQAQLLVANTRFESPDGKIFRIQEKITVPGEKVENGKIIPTGIKTKVVADKAGAEYNIGPTKFTIPGFKGSPKYDGFYAKSESAMSGGFIGEIIFPTDAEINDAKEKTKTALEESLSVFISSQIPKNFKIIDGAKQFNIIKESVNREVDKEGKFSYFMEGELTVAGFKESDLLGLLNSLAKKELGQGFQPTNQIFEYKTGSFDVASGRLNFFVDYKGTFWQVIDAEQFKNSILNKRETDLKAFIFSINGVEKASVSLWPFWVKRVPNNANKVKIEVE